MIKTDDHSFKDVQRLLAAGKTAEARAMFEVLRAKAANAPNEVLVRPNGATVFKRRGKIVIQDADGVWQLAKRQRR